jgi:hypothetical protein
MPVAMGEVLVDALLRASPASGLALLVHEFAKPSAEQMRKRDEKYLQNGVVL